MRLVPQRNFLRCSKLDFVYRENFSRMYEFTRKTSGKNQHLSVSIPMVTKTTRHVPIPIRPVFVKYRGGIAGSVSNLGI